VLLALLAGFAGAAATVFGETDSGVARSRTDGSRSPGAS